MIYPFFWLSPRPADPPVPAAIRGAYLAIIALIWILLPWPHRPTHENETPQIPNPWRHSMRLTFPTRAGAGGEPISSCKIQVRSFEVYQEFWADDQECEHWPTLIWMRCGTVTGDYFATYSFFGNEIQPSNLYCQNGIDNSRTWEFRLVPQHTT